MYYKHIRGRSMGELTSEIDKYILNGYIPVGGLKLIGDYYEQTIYIIPQNINILRIYYNEILEWARTNYSIEYKDQDNRMYYVVLDYNNNLSLKSIYSGDEKYQSYLLPYYNNKEIAEKAMKELEKQYKVLLNN